MYLKKLQVLELFCCEIISDDGVIRILSDENIVSLKFVNLNQTNITDSTLIAVSRQKHLKGLKKFWVNSCHHLTITGVSALIDTWILEGI